MKQAFEVIAEHPFVSLFIALFTELVLCRIADIIRAIKNNS